MVVLVGRELCERRKFRSLSSAHFRSIDSPLENLINAHRTSWKSTLETPSINQWKGLNLWSSSHYYWLFFSKSAYLVGKCNFIYWGSPLIHLSTIESPPPWKKGRHNISKPKRDLHVENNIDIWKQRAYDDYLNSTFGIWGYVVHQQLRSSLLITLFSFVYSLSIRRFEGIHSYLLIIQRMRDVRFPFPYSNPPGTNEVFIELQLKIIIVYEEHNEATSLPAKVFKMNTWKCCDDVKKSSLQTRTVQCSPSILVEMRIVFLINWSAIPASIAPTKETNNSVKEVGHLTMNFIHRLYFKWNSIHEDDDEGYSVKSLTITNSEKTWIVKLFHLSYFPLILIISVVFIIITILVLWTTKFCRCHKKEWVTSFFLIF